MKHPQHWICLRLVIRKRQIRTKRKLLQSKRGNANKLGWHGILLLGFHASMKWISLREAKWKTFLCVIALGMFTLAACQGQSTPAQHNTCISDTSPLLNLQLPLLPPSPQTRQHLKIRLSPNLEAVQYNTIDINHPLETCPVLTDAEIPSYYDWVNGEIQKGGAYLPFGPNAKLIPPIPQQPGG